MVVQVLGSTAYELIRYSWIAAAVSVKYILLAHVIDLAYRKNLSIESFLGKVRELSRETVAGIVGAGVVFSIIGFRPEPLFKLFSQMIAVTYFGYLFWKY